MKYPTVLSEVETLQRVIAGASLARYGDGEFVLASGVGIKCQALDVRLERRLRGILADSGDCLVGIPNLRMDGPKAVYWQRRAGQFAKHLTDREYASAFISRADSAPWINTPEYWALLASLWIDQDVTLVRGASSKALQPSDLVGAREVKQVICQPQHAFDGYDDILELVGTPKRALLCLGPTATVLAVDLCAKGVHAIDLGHAALFLRKARRGEPMVITDADKAAA